MSVTKKRKSDALIRCDVVESALDDLDLNDFGVSALERSLESSSALPSVGVMPGKPKNRHTVRINMSTSLVRKRSQASLIIICLCVF